MGIAGVEGVFRKCCEETMALMRAHQEELRTIVEVHNSKYVVHAVDTYMFHGQ